MSLFSCPLCCHQKFESVSALREHLVYFTYRPLLCAFCSKTIGGIYELIHHLETHLHEYTSSIISGQKYLKPDYKKNEGFNLQTGKIDERPEEIKDMVHSHQSSSNELLNSFSLPVHKSDYSMQASNMSDTLQAINIDKPDDPIGNSDIENCRLSSSEEITNSQVCSSHEGGQSVRAFSCKLCGQKVVGKDFYFLHLQGNCKLMSPSGPSAHFLDRSISHEKMQTNKNDITMMDSLALCKDVSNLKINYELDMDLNKAYKASNEFEYFAEKQYDKCEESSFPPHQITETVEYNSASCSPFSNNINTSYKWIDSSEKGNDNDDLYQSSSLLANKKFLSQPYVHKKFDHDQDRQQIEASSKNDVQCYIQNFQSILVNKLNTAFCANASRKQSVEKEDATATFNVEPPYLDKSSKHLDYKNVFEIRENTDPSLIDDDDDEIEECMTKEITRKSEEIHDQTDSSLSDSYKCNLCSKTFTSTFLMQRHKRETHGPATYYCSECDHKFKSRRALFNHKGIHEKKRFRCLQCPYLCHTQSGLRTHVYEAHGRVNKSISCDICSEKFSKKYTLMRHIERKHTLKDMSCRYCDKVFHCSEDLTRHMNVHSNNNSLACDVCGKMFTTGSSLKRHSQTHDQTNDLFKCRLCGTSFTRRDSLLNHTKLLHESSRQFVCECGKGFLKKSQLLNHSQKHKRHFIGES